MKQMSWPRVRAAFIHLGVVVFRDTEFAVHLNRGAVRVAVLRKISPVPVSRQRELFEIFDFTEEQYLAALAASEPRQVSDDGSK